MNEKLKLINILLTMDQMTKCGTDSDKRTENYHLTLLSVFQLIVLIFQHTTKRIASLAVNCV